MTRISSFSESGFFTTTIKKAGYILQGIITTVAGIMGSSGTTGDGGLAVLAKLSSSSALALDSNTNIYIGSGTSIREVFSSNGIINTVYSNTSSFGVYGICFDSFGNMYVSDDQAVVYKIDANTKKSIWFAGSGVTGTGSDGILANTSYLFYPSGMAVDSFNNLYICDSGSNRIRKVFASNNIITTVVGTGTAGNTGDGGLATLATLNDPSDIAIDSFNNLYISDIGNNKIRKVYASNNIITTVVGTGFGPYNGDNIPATTANTYAWSIAVDKNQNLYIADFLNNRIRKVYASNNIIITIAGNGIHGPGSNNVLANTSNLYWPNIVRVDSLGRIYINDQYNYVIRLVY